MGRSLKSKKSELVWDDSIDVRFESTEHAKSTVEDGVVGWSKSQDDVELIVEISEYKVKYDAKDVSIGMEALNSVLCNLMSVRRSLKSKEVELAWSNSVDAGFESTEHAKSIVEDGVVGGSKSREDAELIVDL